MPTLVIAFVLLLSPAISAATSAVTCHCFKDREYDPARPAAAEPYVQATARNSLLSAAFGIDKGQVVRKLMTGSEPDDLWIAYWVGAKTGAEPERLLADKGARGSWKSVLAGADPGRLGAPFARLAVSGAPEASLAAYAVDDVVAARLKADAEMVKRLRVAGAASHDVILAVLLTPRAKRGPAELFADVRQKKRPWGAVLQSLGLTPKDVDPQIRRAIQ